MYTDIRLIVERAGRNTFIFSANYDVIIGDTIVTFQTDVGTFDLRKKDEVQLEGLKMNVKLGKCGDRVVGER